MKFAVSTTQEIRVVFTGADDHELESKVIDECRFMDQFIGLTIYPHGDFYHIYTIQYSSNSIDAKNKAPELMQAALALIEVGTQHGLTLKV